MRRHLLAPLLAFLLSCQIAWQCPFKQRRSQRRRSRRLKNDLIFNLRISREVEIIQFVSVYSCFEKGCLTNGEKLTRHCRKLLWVMVVLRLLAWTSRCLSVEEGNSTNTCIRTSSFLVAKSPWASIKQSLKLTTHNTNRHRRARFYTLVGQPLPKHLYSVRTPKQNK